MKLDGDWADKAELERLGKLMAEEKVLLLRRTARSGDRSFGFDIGEDRRLKSDPIRLEFDQLMGLARF